MSTLAPHYGWHLVCPTPTPLMLFQSCSILLYRQDFNGLSMKQWHSYQGAWEMWYVLQALQHAMQSALSPCRLSIWEEACRTDHCTPCSYAIGMKHVFEGALQAVCMHGKTF